MIFKYCRECSHSRFSLSLFPLSFLGLNPDRLCLYLTISLNMTGTSFVMILQFLMSDVCDSVFPSPLSAASSPKGLLTVMFKQVFIVRCINLLSWFMCRMSI